MARFSIIRQYLFVTRDFLLNLKFRMSETYVEFWSFLDVIDVLTRMSLSVVVTLTPLVRSDITLFISTMFVCSFKL